MSDIPPSRHPLHIASIVRCGLCGEPVQAFGIGTLVSLTMSVIDHRRTCTENQKEKVA